MMGNESRWGIRVLLGLAAAPALVAQDDAVEQVALRVVAPRTAGQCVIDLGSRDQVQVGDRLVLEPRNAPALNGRVLQVEDRTSLVQVLDPQANLTAGIRGYVLIPRSRRAPVVEPTPVDPVKPVEPAPDEDEWKPGDPLLGRRALERPPRPWERARTVRGRIYGSASLVHTLDSFSQSYGNAGIDVDIDNVAGDARLGTGRDAWNTGTLHFHAAYNNSKEFSGITGDDVRLFELSYEHGGTRYQPTHWQLGRFLPRDMPEFGLLDGGQLSYRTEGGDRFGVTLGFLPELDDDLDSFADAQFAVYYLWNQDVGERVTYGVAYQRTWDRGVGDRDLFILKARWLPLDGWNVASTIWLDVYDGRDDVKNKNLDITRANVFAVRRWVGEGGIEMFYDHEAYPDIRRTDNPQTLLPATLKDAHMDRLSGRFYTETEGGTQWYTRLTGWVDEQREGGTGEIGFDARGLLTDKTHTGLALYMMQGPTSSITGVRVDHGGDFMGGRLDMLYELGFVHFEGFAADRDDLLQHRLGALWNTAIGSGWDASFTADATLWDTEFSFGVGIYLQRLF